jgi:D-glycero-D-manno-heptose 1,7-bisphosphate phosphatase
MRPAHGNEHAYSASVRDRWTGSAERGPLTFQPAGVAPLEPGCAAAFLDRDGTVNEAVPEASSGVYESPLRVEDVRLLDGAAAAACRLADAGYALVFVTNQPAAAKGTATVEQLLRVHERVIELLEAQGVRVHSSRVCLHHPHGIDAGLRRVCDCRKPAPGMLLDAAAALALDLSASWMLGDTDADVGAGRAAGCRTALVEYRDSAHKRSRAARPDLLVADLAAGVAQVLATRPAGNRG